MHHVPGHNNRNDFSGQGKYRVLHYSILLYVIPYEVRRFLYFLIFASVYWRWTSILKNYSLSLGTEYLHCSVLRIYINVLYIRHNFIYIFYIPNFSVLFFKNMYDFSTGPIRRSHISLAVLLGSGSCAYHTRLSRWA